MNNIKWGTPEYLTLRKCAEALAKSRPDKGFESRHHQAYMEVSKMLNEIGDQHDQEVMQGGAA